MSSVKVMNLNYLNSSTLFGTTYSSQLAIAPVTNILDRVRRSKVWRSAGQWEITSSNNVIIFQETIGVNLTATVAASTYTTDALFLAAIKTAMQAVGTHTYTVARDTTTNKIKITANTGTFRLICTSASFTLASVIGFSTASDKTGALTYTADTLKIHTSEFIRWDLGTSSNPKAFILVGLRNTAIKLSPTATITLQGSSTDVWTSPQYSQVLTYDEEAICQFSDTGIHTSGLRYWRLYIQDQSNAYGYVEISNVYLGDALITVRGSPQFPLNESFTDLAQQTYSEFGTSFADVRQQTATFQVQWEGLTVADKESFRDFVSDVGVSYPFFICLDPNSAFSTNVSRWVRYVKFSQMPSAKLVSPGNWSSEWTLREEV